MNLRLRVQILLLMLKRDRIGYRLDVLNTITCRVINVEEYLPKLHLEDSESRNLKLTFLGPFVYTEWGLRGEACDVYNRIEISFLKSIFRDGRGLPNVLKDQPFSCVLTLHAYKYGTPLLPLPPN